jgi:eukaryotic-like serine/threonine-protein kinase
MDLKRLGPYDILSPLGAGGMGEVYRAKDTKLGREVALKILPATFTSDPDRLARFRREAQVLASLNHPHIGAIYGLDEANGQQFLVLELVDGESLDRRIARGRIPVDEVLGIARQIAEALEAAHEKGIIHRDLKPANIALTTDGNVKVLDFGLAKATEPAGGASLDVANSPTISTPAMMTGVGVILGTAAYMSPEQAKGRTADKRSDVWAFGCVLYEMLTGRRAFDGEDVSDTMANVLKSEPDWSALPPLLASIRLMIQRALEKDRQKRIADFSTIRFLLTESVDPMVAQPTPPRARQALFAASAAGAIVATLAAGIWFIARTPRVERPITRFVISLPTGQRFTNASRQVIAISPDGRQIAYLAANRLYVKSMDERDARPITEPGPSAIVSPVFSPDGESIAFWSDGAIKRIAVSGGTAVPITAVASILSGLHWGRQGILFISAAVSPQGNRSRLVRLSGSDPTPHVLFEAADSELLYGPWELPDNRGVLFTITKGIAPNRWDLANVMLRLPSGEQRVLIRGASDARYVSTGHLVYSVGGVLFAVRFDLSHLALNGAPVPIIEGVGRGAPATGATQVAVSETGTLAYVPGPAAMASGGRTLGVFSNDAAPTALPVQTDSYEFPRMSPDFGRIAVGVNTGTEAAIYIYPMSGKADRQRLTVGGRNRFPVWSHDGRRIFFQSDRGGDRAIWWQAADGSGTAQRLTTAEPASEQVPAAASPDGRALLLDVLKDRKFRLTTLSLPDGTLTAFGGLPSFSSTTGVFSPDGKWVAYHRQEGASTDHYARGVSDGIWIEPFPPNGDSHQVAPEGTSHHPLWSFDGREMIYVSGPGLISARAITLKGAFSVGKPRMLDGLAGLMPTAPPTADARTFDRLPDGRFISTADPLLRPSGGYGIAGAPTEIDVVLNWSEELKQRVRAR